MSKAERKPSESYADAQKRSSYEETPEGRPAGRRAEEKVPATSQPFLSIPSLYRFEGLPDNGKASSLLSCQRMEGARTLKTAQEREQANTQICQLRSRLRGLRRAVEQKRDQAKKSAGWMPRHCLPKKDAISCEKPWGAASKHRSMGIRMGNPGRGNARSPSNESIVWRGAPGEVKHLSTRRRRKKTRFP